MDEQRKQARQRYYNELSVQLAHEGLEHQFREFEGIRVFHDGIPICDVKYSGDTYRNSKYPEIPETHEIYRKVAEIASLVKEYMTAMEEAPLMTERVKSLDRSDGYRLLADYNSCVLAGRFEDTGCEFVTWRWVCKPDYVEQGHYHGRNYEAAKADFVQRGQLIDTNRIFTDEELGLLHESLNFYLRDAPGIGLEEERTVRRLIQKIEYAIPELEEPAEAPSEQNSPVYEMNQL